MGVLPRVGRNTIKNYVENRLTDLKYKLIVVRGEKREFEISVYTWLYFIWVTNKDLLYNTENSAQCYAAAWMGKESGGEWIHIHVCLSPSAVHQKLSQHCDIIGYIPIQVKKKKKNLGLQDGRALDSASLLPSFPSCW